MDISCGVNMMAVGVVNIVGDGGRGRGYGEKKEVLRLRLRVACWMAKKKCNEKKSQPEFQHHP